MAPEAEGAGAAAAAAMAHRMLFVRDLLRCDQLPADAHLLQPALRSFVFGNPPQRLHRVRCLGTVVRRCDVPVAADGARETLLYLDDGSGLIPVVLPRAVEGAPAPSGPSIAWRCDPSGPQVGETIEVFGSLHSGEHPALADVDARQRYVCAASWVRERNALQESYRALEIEQLCARATVLLPTLPSCTRACACTHASPLSCACVCRAAVDAQIGSTTFATG
jgi:hypothetical protein